MAKLQRLLQHEARLRHRAFGRIDQQQNAVDHLQDALDLAAEVRVARGIDDVDFRPFIMHGGVLGQNGDAALALQVAGVHHAINHRLIFAVDAALLEHFVHERGLAVVNVGDNCDIPNVLLFSHCDRSLSMRRLPQIQIDCKSTIEKYTTVSAPMQ